MVSYYALVEDTVMYAVLYPPNFLAQSAARPRPELRKKPFALLDGEPPNEVVVAVSRAALSFGVTVGMSRLQVEAFSEVVTVPRVEDYERIAHAALHTVACGFSPRIERVEEHSGTYALDIRGMNKLFLDTAELVGKLRRSAMSAGFLTNVAASENYHAALCVARGRVGVSVVSQGDEANALADLPLSVLPLSAAHRATFATWGIRTCAELAALSEVDLISRMGQAGKKLHLLARGMYPHLMLPIEPSFEAELFERMDLEFPIEELERLLFLLSRMTSSLLDRVLSKAMAIGALRVVLHLDGGKQHERTVKPALPLQDTPTLLKLLQLDLETHPPSAAIAAVELQAQSAPPYRAQHGLFLPQSPAPGQTEILLARLTKLLGEGRVGSPALTDDHRPNAFRLVAFAPPPPRRSDLREQSVSVALRVCRPPQMVRVIVHDGAPSQVFWDGTNYAVLETAGPERVSGQWWTETNWCREEWDVRLAFEGKERISRIAYDPRSRCWYAQGTYD
jgi:protein ImuB